MPKIKSFCDPPSPSKFKPSDDVPDIEEEILLESDSDIGGIVHPLDEENNICDGTFMGETHIYGRLKKEMSGTGTFFYKEPFFFSSLSAAKEKKATMKLRKKKEDDVVSDNRFKLHNGREVFEEKTYLVGIEHKNDVQDFGIEESLSELSQLSNTACQNKGLTKPWSFSLAGVEKGKLKEQSLAAKKAGLAVNKKGLTLKELLQQTSHHNPKVRERIWY
ncbi:hypothetical protein JHK87_001563 [Glycine soja]|nr:hypothetical protein JHK87_001563 [Glycine soja]